MAKKKQQKKRDILKFAAIAVAAVSIVVTLFTSWSSEIFNVISSATYVLGFALLPVILLFVFVFWLKMLVDAFQRQRWLWFVAILIGELLFAIPYLLIKRPTVTSFRPTAWTALVLFVLMWGLQTLPALKDRINPVDWSTLQPTGRQYKAKIITDGLYGYEYHGATTCREMILDNGDYYVDISGGTIKNTDDGSAKLGYEFTFSDYPRTKASGGWGGGQSGESLKVKSVDVDVLAASPTEIGGPLGGCELKLWSTNRIPK